MGGYTGPAVASGFTQGFAKSFMEARDRRHREEQGRVGTALEVLGGLISSDAIRPEAKGSLLEAYMGIVMGKDEKARAKAIDSAALTIKDFSTAGKVSPGDPLDPSQFLNKVAAGRQMEGQPAGVRELPPPPTEGPRSYAPGIFVTPEERSDYSAQAAERGAAARTKGEISGRREAFGAVPGFPELPPAQQVSAISGMNVAGAAPSYQSKRMARASAPTVPIAVNFNPRNGQYTDAQTGEVLTDVVPYEKPAKISMAEQYVANLVSQGVDYNAAVDAYNKRESTRTGVQFIQQGDQWIPVEVTSTTTTRRGVAPLPTAPDAGMPSTTKPAPTAAPRGAGGGRVRVAGPPMGQKDTPEVVAAKKQLNEASVGKTTALATLKDLDKNLAEYERAWKSGDPVTIAQAYANLRGAFGPAPLRIAEAYGQTGRAISDRDREAVELAIKPIGDALIPLAPNIVRGTLRNARRSIQSMFDARINELRTQTAGPAGAMPAAPDQSPPLSTLTDGEETTFANGQVWTLRGGKPLRLK